MLKRFPAASAVLVAGLALSVTACGQVNKLKAKKAWKDANVLYTQQEYKKAIGLYEDVVQNDPDLVDAYFFLGNSYDNLYKPSRKGEAENDRSLTKAIENYKKAVELEKD